MIIHVSVYSLDDNIIPSTSTTWQYDSNCFLQYMCNVHEDKPSNS